MVKVGKFTSKLVNDSEALEVVRLGEIRNMLPARRLNILEKSISRVEAEAQVTKSTPTVDIITCETNPCKRNFK